MLIHLCISVYSMQVMTASALPFWVTQADAHKLDGPDNLDWEADVVGEREARGSQRLLGDLLQAIPQSSVLWTS